MCDNEGKQKTDVEICEISSKRLQEIRIGKDDRRCRLKLLVSRGDKKEKQIDDFEFRLFEDTVEKCQFLPF